MAGFLPYLLGLICAFCSCFPCSTSLGKPESTQPLLRQSRALRRAVSSFRTRLSGTAKEEKGDIYSGCWVCSAGRCSQALLEPNQTVIPIQDWLALGIVGSCVFIVMEPPNSQGTVGPKQRIWFCNVLFPPSHTGLVAQWRVWHNPIKMQKQWPELWKKSWDTKGISEDSGLNSAGDNGSATTVHVCSNLLKGLKILQLKIIFKINFNNLNYCIDEPLILELKDVFSSLLFFFRAKENISKILTGISTTVEFLKFYLMGHSSKELSCTFSLESL